MLSINRYSPPPLIQSITGTKTHSAIVDSGASGYFFTNDAPKNNVDPTSPLIRVGTASGQPMTSTSTYDLDISQIPSEFPTTGHGMTGFQENLVDVGSMCDDNCTFYIYKTCS